MADTVDTRRVQEFEEQPDELQAKLNTLADLFLSSRSTVFFTGAGVSTNAGISDYRGPTGAWTNQRINKLRKKGRAATREEEAELALLEREAKKKKQGQATNSKGGLSFGSKAAMISAQPTQAHMAMSTLIRRGDASHVVTTNLDGLHRKSGLQHHAQLT